MPAYRKILKHDDALVYTAPAMFCPRCRVEYRPGFTQCTDCDLDLVDENPPYPEIHRSELPGRLSRVLWRGTDPHLYLALLGDLGSKKVPCFGTPVNPPLYGCFEEQPEGAYPPAEFEVLVSDENLSFARWILSSVEKLQREAGPQASATDLAAEQPDVSPDVAGICPLCLSEFTTTCSTCPNCGVALRPPQRGWFDQNPGKTLSNLPHAQFLADLRMGLQHEAIPFNNAIVPRRPDALRTDLSVLGSDFARATKVLAQVLQYWEFDRTVNFGPSRDPREPYWSHRAKNQGWYPEDLAFLLWTGNSLSALEGIGMALREHKIAYRVDSPRPGTAKVFIHREDEQPAREVLRDIVEEASRD